MSKTKGLTAAIHAINKNSFLNTQVMQHLVQPANSLSISELSLKYVHRERTTSALSSSNTLEKTQHSNFLYVYFLYAYYLLLVPFRFEKIGYGKYRIRQWVPQQIACACCALLTIISLLTAVRLAVNRCSKKSNPNTFFDLFSESSSLIFKSTVLLLFWKNGKSFENLINFLDSGHLVPHNPYKIESIKIIALFSGAYAILSFTRIIFGATFMHSSDWSPQWLYRRLVAEARYTFFISDTYLDINTAPELAEIGDVDAFLAIIRYFSFQCRSITGLFVDLAILLHVLSVWAPASGFAKMIYQHISNDNHKEGDLFPGEPSFPQNSAAQIELHIKQFENLKHLSFLVGEAIGTAIVPYITEALFYYAIFFDTLLMTSDILTRMVLLFFYTSAVCILTFSAEITRKMYWFKIWLSKDHRKVAYLDGNRLTIILDDLNCHSVGIKASGIFTLDYSFVGLIVSVLLTYFVIRLQTSQEE